MAAAAAAWAPVLRKLSWAAPRRRLVLAGSATFASADTDLPAALLRQMTEPVLWMRSIEALLDAGVSRLVALGPGRTLKGLSREILAARASSAVEVRVA
jgi:[acyl-carrier-protein] S-malonyltransferase